MTTLTSRKPKSYQDNAGPTEAPRHKKRNKKSLSDSFVGILAYLIIVLAVDIWIVFFLRKARGDATMFDWPFHFGTPTKEEKELRRILLDKYARITLMATLMPVVMIVVARVVWRLYEKRGEGGLKRVATDDVDRPVLERRNHEERIAGTWRRVCWWMGGQVVFRGESWGERDLWIFGGLWSIFIAILSVSETEWEYLHFTKRLGILAVAQMPMQYLLALKYVNPLNYLLSTSHESLNRYHRVLGRIVYACMALHAILYFNFFYHAGILETKPFTFVVLMGEIAFLAACALTGTTMVVIRQRSYRLFFVLHLVGAIIVPPMIYFHADHAMPTRVQSLVSISIFALDIVTRRLSTHKSLSAITTISNTTLIKITAPLPPRKIQEYLSAPASHVYISLPPSARSPSVPLLSYKNFQFEAIFSPFTVSSVDPVTNTITLISRLMNGPMTHRLAALASAPGTTIFSASTASREARTLICIDGPYGKAPKHIPRLTSSSVDRVLLVAGGVGATFAFPVYNKIISEDPDAKVDLIWAVRSPEETTWAVSDNNIGIFADTNVSVFITGSDTNSIAMMSTPLHLPAASSPTRLMPRGGLGCGRRKGEGRPDLKAIVDEVFRSEGEERIAVWVCGPADMTRELREYVGVWVEMGRQVEWHNEGFGW